MASEYNYCGQCKWIDDKNKSSWNDTYYCNKPYKGGYHSLTEYACSGFIPDPEKLPKKGSYTPSGCYITTIICNILGYEDNCEVLTILRNFRDNILKQDPKYLTLLIEYDTVGPLISKGIQNEPNNYIFAIGLLEHFIIPCVNAIKNQNYDEAIAIYKNMVMYLHDEFSLPSITISSDTEYDFEALGKGRIRLQSKISEI